MKTILTFSIFLFLSFTVIAQQNVGIGTLTPDASAVLDITANDQGVLLPRMDSTSRKNIVSPVNGLTVYDTSTNSFWYYRNTTWTELHKADAVFENVSGLIRSRSGSSDDFVIGSNTLPANGDSITENLVFFNDATGAFRAGSLLNDDAWASDSLGIASFAVGRNNRATGNFSTAFGSLNEARGNKAFATGEGTRASGAVSATFGSVTEATGIASFATGAVSKAIGENSTAMGLGTSASGSNSASLGRGTKADAYSSLAIGKYNVGGGNPTTWVATDPLFEVGIGASIISKKNAMTILKDGTISFKAYTFPNADGTVNQILQTDGSGNLTWATPLSGADDLGNHTATQDLDMGSQKITDLANPNLANDGANKSYVDGAVAPLITDIQSNETDILNNETSINNNTNNITDNTNDIFTNTTNINNNAANIFNNTLAINTHTSDDMDLSASNELQTLSIVGQNLTLSSGNTITLPDDAGVFETNSNVIQYTGPNDHHFALGLDSLPVNGVPYSEFGYLYDGIKAAIRSGTSFNSFSWSSSEIGTYSVGFGNSTKASGVGSAALGGFTEASGIYSMAINGETQATAFASTAMGRWTDATGDNSLAGGTFTKAEAYSSAAFGRYNVGTGNSTSWVESDPLFEVGNGADHLNKSNALTILKNGTVSFENYTFPNVDGNAEDVLKTDGSGNITWGIPNSIKDTEGDTDISFNNVDNKILFTTNNVVTAKIEPDSMYIDGTLKVGTGGGSSLYVGNTLLRSTNSTTFRINANVRPRTDDTYNIGSSIRRWDNIYAINSLIQTSDRRLKKNITTLSHGLESVLKINPVQYHWNKESNADKQHLGLIAQELLELIPEAVNQPENEEEYLGVKYAELVPVLIKAIQDQQSIIDSQNESIDHLNSEISDIKKIIGKLVNTETKKKLSE